MSYPNLSALLEAIVYLGVLESLHSVFQPLMRRIQVFQHQVKFGLGVVRNVLELKLDTSEDLELRCQGPLEIACACAKDSHRLKCCARSRQYRGCTVNMMDTGEGTLRG